MREQQNLPPLTESAPKTDTSKGNITLFDVEDQKNQSAKLNTLEAKFSALEVKIDKIINHFGVK